MLAQSDNRPVWLSLASNHDKGGETKEKNNRQWHKVERSNNEKGEKVHLQRMDFDDLRDENLGSEISFELVCLVHIIGINLENKEGAIQDFINSLDRFSNLKVLVLQGIGNSELVKTLLDSGIPVVLASQATDWDSVFDNCFESFFSALFTGQSVLSAYQDASKTRENWNKEIQAVPSSGFENGIYAATNSHQVYNAPLYPLVGKSSGGLGSLIKENQSMVKILGTILAATGAIIGFYFQYEDRIQDFFHHKSFSEDSYFNVLISPFEGIGTNEKGGFEEQIARSLDQLNLEFEGDPLSIIILDEEKNSILGAAQYKDAESLGEKYNADLVIWGTYQVEADTPTLNIKYSFLGNTEIPFHQRQGVVEGEPLQRLKKEDHGSFSGKLNSVVRWLLGLKFYKIGDYSQAVICFKAISAKEEQAYSNVYRMVADSYLNLSEYDSALIYYNSSLRLDTANFAVLNNRAILHKRVDKIDLALADINRGLEIAPDDPDLLINRGSFYQVLAEQRPDDREKLLEDALADYQLGIESRQSNSTIAGASNIGIIYWQKGDTVRALKMFDLAIQVAEEVNLEKEKAMPLINRGICLSGIGEQNKALTDFSNAIQIDSTLVTAFSSRGNVYVKKGQWELALNDFSKAIEFGGETASNFTSRGVVHVNLSQFENAEQDFSRAISLDPMNAEPLYLRGAVLIGQGRIASGQRDFEEAAKLAGEGAIGLGSFVNNFLYQELYPEAIALLNHLIKVDPNNSGFLYNRAYAKNELGRLEEALADLSLALSINPYYREAHFLRAGINYQKKQYQEAWKDYEVILERFPKDTLALYNGALCLQYWGRNEQAIGLLEELISITPQNSNIYLLQAQLYLDEENSREAISSLKRLLLVSEEDYLFYGRIGDIYNSLSEGQGIEKNNSFRDSALYFYDRTIDFAEDALIPDSLISHSLYNKGVLLYSFYPERRIDGVNSIKKAVELSPENRFFRRTLNQIQASGM